jgi:rfaE bifunctional protein nucleotidyltransferase chain/domain
MSAKVVGTIGVYDLLHVGHIAFLQAAAFGDILVVGIPNDELTFALKGRYPVIVAAERADMLMATSAVEAVYILKSFDYAAWVRAVEPDVLVLSVDHTAERFVEAERAVAGYGGQVVRLPRSPRNSTTAIIDRAIAIREGKI